MSDNLKAFAPVVGSLIAFTGAVCVALMTFYITKRAERRREKEKLDHDVGALRAGLQAEFSQIVRIVAGEIEFIETKGSSVSFVPILNWFAVYKANLTKLGLLSEKEVLAVTRSFYYIQERTTYVIRWGDDFVIDSVTGVGSVKYNLDNPELRTRVVHKLGDIHRDAAETLSIIQAAAQTRST